MFMISMPIAQDSQISNETEKPAYIDQPLHLLLIERIATAFH